MERHTLKKFFEERLQSREVNLERLAQKTGVAERHIGAILNGDLEKLPAAPYIRGYLMKIAQALDLDANEVMLMYRQETSLRTSGAKDLLPSNRFRLTSSANPRFVLFSAGGLLALVIFGFFLFRILNRPELRLINPSLPVMTVSEREIVIEGSIEPGDKIIIGGDEVPTDSRGEFSYPYTLEPGLNTIEFVVTKILGRETRLTRQVVYQPTEAQNPKDQTGARKPNIGASTTSPLPVPAE